jgi:hypothetical protein
MLSLIVVLGVIYGVIFGIAAGYIFGKVNIFMFNLFVRFVSADVAITLSSMLAILIIGALYAAGRGFALIIPPSLWVTFNNSELLGIFLGFLIRKFLISKK